MISSPPSLSGVNHVTLCVTDLARSIAFYRDLLGATLRMTSPGSAYLELGPLWLCLEKTGDVRPRSEDSHIAFTCADIAAATAHLTGKVTLWKDNRSEGASLYLLDPDGHKLELHAGDLESRLAHYRAEPPEGMILT